MLFGAVTSSFAGFGPCSIRRQESPANQAVDIPRDRLTARKLIRQNCPKTPGVYGMVDEGGALIYVGKAKSLRNRLLCYLLPESEDSKAHRIIARTQRLFWEPAGHEFIALLRELDLIRRYKPGFNVQGQPGRRRLSYVCIGRQPAPYVYVAPAPSRRTDTVYGPLRGAGRLQDAVRRLNDSLGLRDCPEHVPMVFANQLEIFAEQRTAQCLRYEMQNCLAPCMGACTTADYTKQVGAARSFLQGKDISLLQRYETQMRAAAEGRQFERAAALRDAWADLAWLSDQLERLRWFRGRHAFIYELETVECGLQWHLFSGGRVRSIVDAPTNRRRARRCQKRLMTVYEDEIGVADCGSHEDLEAILLTASWFRRYPSELDRTLLPTEAHERCSRICAAK
jgi:excinuclease ABC subunit C